MMGVGWRPVVPPQPALSRLGELGASGAAVVARLVTEDRRRCVAGSGSVHRASARGVSTHARRVFRLRLPAGAVARRARAAGRLPAGETGTAAYGLPPRPVADAAAQPCRFSRASSTPCCSPPRQGTDGLPTAPRPGWQGRSIAAARAPRRPRPARGHRAGAAAPPSQASVTPCGDASSAATGRVRRCRAGR